MEVAALFALYGLYQVIRGFGELDFEAAQRNTAAIVAVEQRLQVFVERGIQDWALGVPGLMSAYQAGNVTLANAVGTATPRDPRTPPIRNGDCGIASSTTNSSNAGIAARNAIQNGEDGR